ncbi:MAG: hypothetical protein WDN67_05500 [Candidatus Moraniibacteriota bacterium]
MRTIALSNLSILSTSLFRGPRAAWERAQAAGFDALKINPLRGWTARRIRKARIPVVAFEAPWRFSFLESLSWAKQGEVRALLIDPLLFGYQGADRRAREYARSFPDIVGVDCPPDYIGDFVSVEETDAQKRPNPVALLNSQVPILFDTWHIRGYSDHENLLLALKEKGRIKAIDVQSRELTDWILLLKNSTVGPLVRQLAVLSSLPQEVSASVELHPFHIKPLAKYFEMSREEVLAAIQYSVRYALK